MSERPERNLTDGELDRLKTRNPAEIRRVVDDLARPLYRAARGMGFNQSDADDLVQEVFVTFMATLDRFEGRSRMSTWLFGILHHKAQERRRGLAREDTQEPIDEQFEAAFDARGMWAAPPPDLERLVESRQLGEAIRGCLDGLPGPFARYSCCGRWRTWTWRMPVRLSGGPSLTLGCNCTGHAPGCARGCRPASDDVPALAGSPGTSGR